MENVHDDAEEADPLFAVTFTVIEVFAEMAVMVPVP